LKIFLGLESQLRDRPFYLKGGWGGYGFLFRSEFFFRTKLEYFFFFPEFNIRLYVKTLNQIIFFFLHRNQNIFFSNIWNQNIFLEKKHNPPFKLNGRSLMNSLSSPESIHILHFVGFYSTSTSTILEAAFN
jgi:hypothetical protein